MIREIEKKERNNNHQVDLEQPITLETREWKLRREQVRSNGVEGVEAFLLNGNQ